jgi:hypothetical protein
MRLRLRLRLRTLVDACVRQAAWQQMAGATLHLMVGGRHL